MNFKCKMCGGELNIVESTNICVCPYCKTKQTLPKIDTEIEKQLFDRANYYRFSNEFDKALPIYEQILATNPKESEAFWGVLLCRYGVEYVEDTKTKKRIPTCHRTCYESILNDMNYKSALKYADVEARKIYEEEAFYIDSVQKKIKEISSKESPFDIFICYKESNGNDRTIDSVIAEEIYDSLTQKGYKVFFSRISLEGKIGTEYEPYIYAALISARVMLVVGCNKENMNSIWVRNEWQRYLDLIKDGKEKTLIPCYKTMDPYDLPDEFVALQAQDMGKVGAMQDLLRGIDKIIKPTGNQIDASTVNAHILKTSLDSAFEYLRQSKWNEALKRLDNAKDYDAHSAMIYLGYLMIDLKLNSLEELENYPNNYFDNRNYQMVLKYADKELKGRLDKYKESTEKVIEQNRKIIEERRKENQLKRKKRIKKLIILSIVFMIMAVISFVIFKVVIPNNKYDKAIKLMEDKNYTEALEIFREVGDIKESFDKRLDCITEIQLKVISEDEIKEQTSDFKRNLNNFGKERMYKVAKAYYDISYYDEFEELYQYIKEYEDSDKMHSDCIYNQALKFYDDGNEVITLDLLNESRNFGNENAKNKFEEVGNSIYNRAMSEYNKTNYGTAKGIFALITDYDYSDSKAKYQSCLDKIESEKSSYYGIWLEVNEFWYNLKIDESGIYAADQIDTKRGEWDNGKIKSVSYDEDNATFSFDYWEGHSYIVKKTGNRLKLTCTNLKDEYDSDWFGSNNVFRKQ